MSAGAPLLRTPERQHSARRACRVGVRLARPDSTEASSRLYLAQEALGFTSLTDLDKLHDSLEMASKIINRALADLPNEPAADLSPHVARSAFSSDPAAARGHRRDHSWWTPREVAPCARVPSCSCSNPPVGNLREARRRARCGEPTGQVVSGGVGAQP